MSTNQLQINILNTRLTTLNAMRTALLGASASTAEVDTQITDATNALSVFNTQLTAEQTLAQNNIDLASAKQTLITNLGTGLTTAIMSSVICSSVHDGCPCISCKYANYISKGLTNEQIKLLL